MINSISEIEKQLEDAWNFRLMMGAFRNSDAVRVFHGRADGKGPLRSIAIELFGSGAWVTEWDDAQKGASHDFLKIKPIVARFLTSKGMKFGVWLARPKSSLPQHPETLFGEVPKDPVTVREEGLEFEIQFKDVRHPGLFLDHIDLRKWLKEGMKDQRVLNTFAYTGSLSVAAGVGGAAHVTTIDLSRPTVSWAERNWAKNGLRAESGTFIAGDIFEWLPRFKRQGKYFDCVILDPPSFSRGKSGTFSTSRDLEKLHSLALELLTESGILVSSINSAKVSLEEMSRTVTEAARTKKMKLKWLKTIEQPLTFPSALEDPEGRYLKGFVLMRTVL